MTHPNFWFHPTRSGDFRLIRLEEGRCELTVMDPTPQELVVLGNLRTAARANGWMKDDVEFAPVGETVVELETDIAQAGPLVSGSLHGDAKLWTAVRWEGGNVVVVSGQELPKAPPAVSTDGPLRVEDPAPAGWARYEDCAKCSAPAGMACTDLRHSSGRDLKAAHKGRKLTAAALAAAAVAGAKAEAAVTVREPYRGCPAPTAAVRRASEVLRVFSTGRQMDQWDREGRMGLLGSRTGRAYTLYHRDEAAQRGLTHVLIENRTGDAICCWDHRVPAEEEALGIKLAVEHREGFLRRLPRGAALRHMDGQYRETHWPGGRRVVAVIANTPYDA